MPKKTKLLIMGGVIAVMVLQIAIDIDLHHNLNKKSADDTITQLITMSVNNLYKPAAVDAKTGAVYLPEARITLPAIQSPGNQLLYSYNTTDKTDPELVVTTNNLIHQGEAKLLTATSATSHATDAAKLSAMFAQVPNLQACARGVALDTRAEAISDSLQTAMTLQLKDGRTLYGYRDTTCHEDMAPLLSELKQAESY